MQQIVCYFSNLAFIRMVSVPTVLIQAERLRRPVQGIAYPQGRTARAEFWLYRWRLLASVSRRFPVPLKSLNRDLPLCHSLYTLLPPARNFPPGNYSSSALRSVHLFFGDLSIFRTMNCKQLLICPVF